MSTSATAKLISLASRLKPTGVIGDGMVAQFHDLAARAASDGLDGERSLIVAYLRHLASLRPADASALRLGASDIEAGFHRDPELNPAQSK